MACFKTVVHKQKMNVASFKSSFKHSSSLALDNNIFIFAHNTQLRMPISVFCCFVVVVVICEGENSGKKWLTGLLTLVVKRKCFKLAVEPKGQLENVCLVLRFLFSSVWDISCYHKCALSHLGGGRGGRGGVVLFASHLWSSWERGCPLLGQWGESWEPGWVQGLT